MAVFKSFFTLCWDQNEVAAVIMRWLKGRFPEDLFCLSVFFLLICLGFQTINTAQAVFLPVGASFSLLVMFFFFDTLQFFFALCTAGE